MLNVRGDVYAEYSKFEKGEYFSWSCHLDYKQTMSRDSPKEALLYQRQSTTFYVLN